MFKSRLAELPFSYFSAPGEKKSTIAPVFCILTGRLGRIVGILRADRRSVRHLGRGDQKLHEETVRGSLAELIEHFTATEPRAA